MIYKSNRTEEHKAGKIPAGTIQFLLYKIINIKTDLL